MVEAVKQIPHQLTEQVREFLDWAERVRTLGVRANADTPEDARKAREFGAEGIGLVRTEHMFFAPERIPRSEEHTSELQSRLHLVCRLLLEKKKKYRQNPM